MRTTAIARAWKLTASDLNSTLPEGRAKFTLAASDEGGCQEFLSQMLGVRRASVSLIAATLQKAGLIRYSRGKMNVLDREELEEISCECYGTVKEEFNRLLGGN